MAFALRMTFAVSLALGVATPLHAQSTPNPTEVGSKSAPANENKPQLGTIGASGGAGFGTRTTEMPWAPDNDKGDSTPISGSVNKDGRDWNAKVFNNTDFSYNVDVQVIQYNKNHSQLKSDSFSATIKPKSFVQRKFSSASSATEGELKLVGAKKLGGK